MSSFLEPNQKIDKQDEKLPHWLQGEKWIFVTWRLADSLPQSKLLKWKEEREIWISLNPKPWDTATEAKYYQRFNDTMDHWLDAGYGSCALATKENAEIMASALRHFNHQHYRLESFVVMPNHVHVLFKPLEPKTLRDIIKSWKQFSAKEINRRENTSGQFWQANYWDRLIRSQEHFDWTKRYIQNNPKNLKPGSYTLWSGDL